MNRSSIYLFSALLLLISYSCKKEFAPEEAILGNWKLTELESDYLGPMIDVYPFLQPCFTDNILMFFPDNTFIMDEGETKCTETANQIYEQGDWIFQDNAKIIKYGIYEVEILEFTETRLKSTYQLVDTTLNKTSTFIQTFTKVQ